MIIGPDHILDKGMPDHIDFGKMDKTDSICLP